MTTRYIVYSFVINDAEFKASHFNSDTVEDCVLNEDSK